MGTLGEVRVLVVDDEPGMLENCERILTREGHKVLALADPTPIRSVLNEFRPDVLLLDLRMPQADGMTVLTVALADDPSLPVLIMTAYATVASAVEAIREGAFDYLTKPFSSDQLVVAVERAARHSRLAKENEALRQQIAEADAAEPIVGSSPIFLRLLDQARKIAPTNSNVLLQGESGTGKEIIARFIHAKGGSGDRPFVPIDCAALPPSLLESELFGFERGAFTGAEGRKIGQLQEAHGGTVFLDEIGELSLELQSKFLRVIETRQIRRLGGSELLDVDFRVIAATNRNLEAEVAEGRFREDLYYRLNVIPLYLPPLRDRPGDIALLLKHFVEQFSAKEKRAPPQVTPSVWETLESYGWPGNIREVRNLAERLVVLDETGRISLSNLPELLRPSIPGATVESSNLTSYDVARENALKAFRTDYVERLLETNDRNVSKAAKVAGISRRTLHRWLADAGGSESGETP